MTAHRGFKLGLGCGSREHRRVRHGGGDAAVLDDADLDPDHRRRIQYADQQGADVVRHQHLMTRPATCSTSATARTPASAAWNLNTNTFIGTIGGGQFTGQTGNNSTSGADGTAAFTTTGPNPVHLVLGGDGNSTVKAYAITGNGTSLSNYSATPLYTVNTNLGGVVNPTANNPRRRDVV